MGGSHCCQQGESLEVGFSHRHSPGTQDIYLRQRAWMEVGSTHCHYACGGSEWGTCEPVRGTRAFNLVPDAGVTSLVNLRAPGSEWPVQCDTRSIPAHGQAYGRDTSSAGGCNWGLSGDYSLVMDASLKISRIFRHTLRGAYSSAYHDCMLFNNPTPHRTVESLVMACSENGRDLFQANLNSLLFGKIRGLLRSNFMTSMKPVFA